MSIRNLPFVTLLLMGACIANYIRISQVARTEGMHSAAVDCGAMYRPYVTENHQYYRFFTAGFVHFSLWHILMNLYCLYQLGPYFERLYGHVWFAILMVGAIVIGNLFAFTDNANTISGGMSSGIYGLLAAQLVLIYVIAGPAAILRNTGLLISIVINVMMNFMPGISWRAHLGGAAFGVLLTVFLLHM
jgi:rhomboid protease GluP